MLLSQIGLKCLSMTSHTNVDTCWQCFVVEFGHARSAWKAWRLCRKGFKMATGQGHMSQEMAIDTELKVRYLFLITCV
jgi:hypothetical protein